MFDVANEAREKDNEFTLRLVFLGAKRSTAATLACPIRRAILVLVKSLSVCAARCII